jgi:hypothetical protein
VNAMVCWDESNATMGQEKALYLSQNSCQHVVLKLPYASLSVTQTTS